MPPQKTMKPKYLILRNDEGFPEMIVTSAVGAITLQPLAAHDRFTFAFVIGGAAMQWGVFTRAQAEAVREALFQMWFSDQGHGALDLDKLAEMARKNFPEPTLMLASELPPPGVPLTGHLIVPE